MNSPANGATLDTIELPDVPTQAQRDNPKHWNLSYRQMRFAQRLFLGDSQRRALIAAGYAPSTNATADSTACRLASNVKVQRYLSHLNAIAKRSQRSATLSRVAKREILADVAYGCDDTGHRLKAIEIDNRMEGHDTATLQIDGSLTLTALLADIQPSTGLPTLLQ